MKGVVKRIFNKDNEVDRLLNTCRTELRRIYSLKSNAAPKLIDTTNLWLSYGYFIHDKLVGNVEVLVNDSCLHVRTLGVLPEYRQNGVARSLILGVANQFANISYVNLACIAQTGNVAIFEKMGFVEVSRGSSEVFELVNGDTAIEVELALPLVK